MLDRFRAFGRRSSPRVAHLLIRLGAERQLPSRSSARSACARAGVLPAGEAADGVLVITAFVFSDLIDGHMARLTGKASPFGAFLDSTLDRIGDGAERSSPAWRSTSPAPGTAPPTCRCRWSAWSWAASSPMPGRAPGRPLRLEAKVGIAERAWLPVCDPPGCALFDLPILMEVTLWALAAASTITVQQRVWVVRRQALAHGRLTPRPACGRACRRTIEACRSTPPPSTPPTAPAPPVKRGMAEMLKGGVIMDVVTAEQAKIAEDAGAVAVMALEHVPRTSARRVASPG